MQFAWPQIVPSVLFGVALGVAATSLFPSSVSGTKSSKEKAGFLASKAADRSERAETNSVTINYARVAEACLRAAGNKQAAAPHEPTEAELAERAKIEDVIVGAENRGVWTRADTFVVEGLRRTLGPDLVAEVNERLRALAESDRVSAESRAMIPVHR